MKLKQNVQQIVGLKKKKSKTKTWNLNKKYNKKLDIGEQYMTNTWDKNLNVGKIV